MATSLDFFFLSQTFSISRLPAIGYGRIVQQSSVEREPVVIAGERRE